MPRKAGTAYQAEDTTYRALSGDPADILKCVRLCPASALPLSSQEAVGGPSVWGVRGEVHEGVARGKGILWGRLIKCPKCHRKEHGL